MTVMFVSVFGGKRTTDDQSGNHVTHDINRTTHAAQMKSFPTTVLRFENLDVINTNKYQIKLPSGFACFGRSHILTNLKTETIVTHDNAFSLPVKILEKEEHMLFFRVYVQHYPLKNQLTLQNSFRELSSP